MILEVLQPSETNIDTQNDDLENVYSSFQTWLFLVSGIHVNFFGGKIAQAILEFSTKVAPLLDAWLLAVDMAEAGQIINDPHSIAAKPGNPWLVQGNRIVGEILWFGQISGTSHLYIS